MKKRMDIIVRALALILSVMTVIGSALPIFAEEEEKKLVEFSEDLGTVTFKGREYYLYSHKLPYSVIPEKSTYYRLIDKSFSESYFELELMANTDEIIIINKPPCMIYATEEGARMLSKANIDEASYVILASGRGDSRDEADMDVSKIKEWDAEEKNINIEVTRLAGRKAYEILLYDESKSLAYVYGAIYQMARDEYIYVNYDALDNTYFDSRGEFSYRSGSVSALSMSDSQVEYIKQTVKDMEYVRVNKLQLQWAEAPEPIPDEGAKIGFIIMWLIPGVLVPAGLGAIGVRLAHSKKSRHPKDWYQLTAVCGAWVICALVLLIMIVF